MDLCVNSTSSTAAAGLVPVRVAARRQLADQTWLFELKRVDGTPAPATSAGSHVDVELPDGTLRQYSLLTGVCADPAALAIGVKRDAQGRGGSLRLCDTVQEGALLRVSAPRNNFALHEGGAPAVLVAGGIGITPIWSMTRELARRGTPWELHYACRSRAEAALAAELADDPRVHFFFDDEAAGGHIDLAAIVAGAPADAHLYCCGPSGMLDAFAAAAQAWPQERVHVERFSAAQPLARAEEGYVVRLARSGQEFTVAPGQTILETLRCAGVDAPSSCEQGICGACETRVLEGEIDHRDSILSPTEQASQQVMMICCSGSKGGPLVLDL